MAGPGQFGQSTLNMWAMLRDLVYKKVGILAMTGVPVNGTSGSYVGKAGKGTLVIDTETGLLYQNRGTLASPVWYVITGTAV